ACAIRCHAIPPMHDRDRLCNSPSTPTPSSHVYTLSLHDALPILTWAAPDTASMATVTLRSARTGALCVESRVPVRPGHVDMGLRSEEHTSELQSPYELVCCLLLEKKKLTWPFHSPPLGEMSPGWV